MNSRVWRVDICWGRLSIQPLVAVPEGKSLNDISLQLPGGAYTTFRTYEGGKALHLEDHFTRLEQTAALTKDALHLDRNCIREALRWIIKTYPFKQDLRIRLTLDLEDSPGMLYITSEVIQDLPPEAYQRGVCVVTCALHRLLPQAKLTRFIARAEGVRQELPDGVNEAIMVGEDGRFKEGLSSNFFAIQQGEIWTAGREVLSGVTRSIILDGAANLGIPVHQEGYPMDNLARLEEAFITSSSRGVLPVVQIDATVIGSGRPGKITLQLMAYYAERVLIDLEDI